jgi:uncharacterized protein YbjT (DUF2867 family)
VKILVVGLTGGLGRDIVMGALVQGHATAALARDPSRAVLPPEVEVVSGDALDPSSPRPALTRREAVICALGTPSSRKPSTLLRDGTENLIGAMSEQDCGGWFASRPSGPGRAGQTARSSIVS